MTDTPYLRQLLSGVFHHKPPAFLDAAKPLLATERAWVETLLKSQPVGTIYGFNTERDHHAITSASVAAFQKAIVASHHLRPAHARGNYPRSVTVLIGYVKAFQLSRGGSGISPAAYTRILERIAEPCFTPRIPAGQSYSSGDVLPATHWAHAVFGLDGHNPYPLQAGEMIAAINGNFVHTALAVDNYRDLTDLQAWVVVSAAYAGRLCAMSRIHFARVLPPHKQAARPALDYLERLSNDSPNRATSTQRAVSLRAIPEVVIAFCQSHQAMGEEIEVLLTQPSGNPLFDVARQEVFSSPSFLAIDLALAQNSMIETLLFVLRAAVTRLSFILSGRVAGIPEDGVDPTSAGLGLIQVPKELNAVVESAYQSYGRRGFAAGGATSHGIEDLWTHGEALSRDLHQLIAVTRDVLRREIAVYEVLGRRYKPDCTLPLGLAAVTGHQEDIVADMHAVEDHLQGAHALAGAWPTGRKDLPEAAEPITLV